MKRPSVAGAAVILSTASLLAQQRFDPAPAPPAPATLTAE